jgi:DNA (cytosine-5)-methyltransferase 1
MNELALFAGAGGGMLGGGLLGWRTVCAVELDPYAASILVARQNDGLLPGFPIWDDVRTFDGRPWRGIVDVVSGGFPCQDISAAGKGAGIDGKRSILWRDMARIIGEAGPRYVFVENSPMLAIRGLGTILCDLSALGFDAEWGIVSASDVGAPHRRERLWILAHSNHVTGRVKQQQPVGCAARTWDESDWGGPCCVHNSWWDSEPAVVRVAHGVAARVDRLRAIGNGQVPAVAATAFKMLAERGGFK